MSFAIILKLLTSGIGFLRDFLIKLLSDPKILMILIISFFTLYVYNKNLTKIENLENSVKIEQAAKNKAQNDFKEIKKANEENVKTIEKLNEEKIKNEKSVNDLKIQIGRDRKNINELMEKIDSYSKEDDGPISKILGDTIKEIQKLRNE